jgi:tetratricopeptide (TPR) repeat protein
LLFQDLSQLPATSFYRLEEAETYHRRELALWEGLVADSRTRPADREQIGHCQRLWGGRLTGAGRLEEAAQAYREAIGPFEHLNGTFPEVQVYWHYLADTHRILGLVLAASKRLPEAEQAYRRAVELHEKSVARFPDLRVNETDRAASYFDLARFLMGAGQAKEAEDLYRKGLQVQPTNALAHNNLAWMLAAAPDSKARAPARALEPAQKAVALAPQVATFWRTLGVAYYRAGDWQAAIAALNKSRELKRGGDTYDWLFLAMAHRKLGHEVESQKAYAQAVRWLEQNSERLSRDRVQAEELRRFRSGAEEVLELKKK